MTSADATERGHILKLKQAKRLEDVLEAPVEVHGRGNFPTLELRLYEFLLLLRKRLEERCVTVKELRLNGGAAASVIGSDDGECLPYNDVDLIFAVGLSYEHDMQLIKDCVLECLLHYMPSGVNKNRLSGYSLNDAYVSKMKKVWTDNDRWSLLSLSNNQGKNVELKFVDRMKRQFEFSVDSFQITLDEMLKYCSAPDKETPFPDVRVESKYGDFHRACAHLRNKVIATVRPEEIRGGGLLKYCQLLARGFHTECSHQEEAVMEQMMCTRFFIDFPDWSTQYYKLDSYLGDHFGDDFHLMQDYLCELYRVVQNSSVCLMSHERQMALGLINDMCIHVLYEEGRRNHCKDVELDLFSIGDSYVVDRIYYFGPNPYKGVTPTMQAYCCPVPSGPFHSTQYGSGPPSPM